MRTKQTAATATEICKCGHGVVVSAGVLVLVAMAPVAHAQEFRTYFVTDVLGSPVVATDQYANATVVQEYRPYGERVVETVVPSKDDDNKRWYTGAEQNEFTGLIELGHRFYDPVVARFVSVDPVGVSSDEGENFNRYWYANNNPFKYVDPTGLLVTVVLDTKEGTITVTDVDTKKTATVQAFTGGRIQDDGSLHQPNTAPYLSAPKGGYEIVDNPNPRDGHEDWFGLFRRDELFDDYFVEGDLDRNGVRLHMGWVSHGCVTIRGDQEDAAQKWQEFRDIIANTKTRIVDFKAGPHFWNPIKQTVDYGTLYIR